MTQEEYENKRRECWEEYWKPRKAYRRGDAAEMVHYDAFSYAFDRAYALGKQEKDAEGEEMLTVSRKDAQKIYKESRHIVSNEVYGSKIYSMHLQIMCVLENLFGSKCLPDESEPPILSKVEKIGKNCKDEPKFKLGDVVRIKPNAAEYHQGYQNGYAWLPERNKYVGKVFSIINIWESGTIFLNIPDCVYWESIDLEPYTVPLSQNPTENCDNEKVISKSEPEEPTCTETWTNVCPSPLPSQDEPDRDLCDKLIQRGFKNHNRLHLASIIMAGLLASDKDKHPVKRALELADALISETKKGSEQ